MRDALAKALLKAAEEDDRIRIVVADISPVGALNEFANRNPDRFINVGVAEQAMIGICAGLALRGLRPFAYTIAPFALYRPFEFIRDDLCYQNVPVTVVGMGAGLVYSNLGPTHHSIEDVSIACALPNMQVISPCDPLECEQAVAWCARESKGPTYLRIGKAGEPVVSDRAQPWEFGKVRHLLSRRSGHDIGSGDGHIGILFHGAISRLVVQVAAGLASRSVSLYSVHTLKPLDRDRIAQILTDYEQVIVIEEHVPHGGLAAMVKEIAWDSVATCDLRTFTLKDEFVSSFSTHGDILAAHGLTAENIVNACSLRSQDTSRDF